MLKADFHMHTHYSPDAETTPEQLVARCLKVGLNCIAVTDHNTIEGAVAVQRLAPFMVIIGEEIKSSDGEITGLFLKEPVPRDLPAAETVRLIKTQGGIVSIPHPFDRFRRSVIRPAALQEIIPQTDVVEAFNARNNFESSDRKAYELAQEHGLLTSGVSDAHTTYELGRTYVEMPEFDGTPDGFLAALAEGKIVGKRTTPLIHVLTTLTKVKRRLLGGTRRPPVAG